MDMRLVVIEDHPSTIAKLAVIATFLFLLVVLPLAVRRRRLGAGLTLFPLLLNGAVAYAGLGRLLETMALTGVGSVVATSAGIADAQVTLIFGATVAVLTALVAMFSAWRRPTTETQNRLSQVVAIVAAVVAALEPPFAFVVTRYGSPLMLAVIAVFVALGALFALAASRGAAVRPLLIVAMCEIGIGIEAWLVLRHFRDIAIYGIR